MTRKSMHESDRRADDNFKELYAGARTSQLITDFETDAEAPFLVDGEGTIVAGDAQFVKLPEPKAGTVVRFIATAAALLTIQQNGGEKIDGTAESYTALDAAKDTVTLEADGTDWFIVASSIAPSE